MRLYCTLMPKSPRCPAPPWPDRSARSRTGHGHHLAPSSTNASPTVTATRSLKRLALVDGIVLPRQHSDLADADGPAGARLAHGGGANESAGDGRRRAGRATTTGRDLSDNEPPRRQERQGNRKLGVPGVLAVRCLPPRGRLNHGPSGYTVLSASKSPCTGGMGRSRNAQGVGKFFRGAGAAGRAFCQTLQTNRFEIGGNVRPEFTWRPGFVVEEPVNHLVTRSLERSATCQQYVHEHSQAVDVGGGADCGLLAPWPARAP